MVQVSPDTGLEGWDWCSGYHYSDSSIIGFSHTHLSGTGRSDLMDVLIMPFTGEVKLQREQKKIRMPDIVRVSLMTKSGLPPDIIK